MKKVKILRSECPENLELDVNQWLEINSTIKITNISISNQPIQGYCYMAILYEE